MFLWSITMLKSANNHSRSLLKKTTFKRTYRIFRRSRSLLPTCKGVALSSMDRKRTLSSQSLQLHQYLFRYSKGSCFKDAKRSSMDRKRRRNQLLLVISQSLLLSSPSFIVKAAMKTSSRNRIFRLRYSQCRKRKPLKDRTSYCKVS